MLKKISKVDQFIRNLELLVRKSDGASPKTLHTGAKRILDRCGNFTGSTIEDLIEHIVTPQPQSKKAKSRGTRNKSSSKLRKASPELVQEAVLALRKLEKDEHSFDQTVRFYNKSCDAESIKTIASQYAATRLPTTKSKAVELLLKARANRIRSRQKQKESAEARPW